MEPVRVDTYRVAFREGKPEHTVVIIRGGRHEVQVCISPTGKSTQVHVGSSKVHP